jgi:hypothetical protein
MGTSKQFSGILDHMSAGVHDQISMILDHMSSWRGCKVRYLDVNLVPKVALFDSQKVELLPKVTLLLD